MPQAWKEWEGRVLNEDLHLGEYLGGSEHAGVFVAQFESRKAAIKLIPVGAWDQAAEAELWRLQSACELSHPHLLRIFQAGRAKLEDTELLFVVMEYAEEDLSEILPKRPLTAGEVREMLRPILDALGYLHGKGLVHGHLKPANVMAIADQLKLSSDGISASGERRGAPGPSSEYDAPEIARGENSGANDVWSLGVLLVMALTQRLPGWDASREEAILPEGVPPPFDDIVRHCLRREAHARWSLADIAERLGFESAAEPAVAEPESEPSEAPARSVLGPQLAAPQRRAIPAPKNFPYKQHSNTGAYVVAAVLMVIVGIFAGTRLFRSGAIDSQTDSTAQEEPTATARASSGIARVRDEGRSGGASSAANSRANLQPGGEKSGGLSGAREKTPQRRLTPGQVAEQTLPDVPQSARDTIRGTVRVGVRISVDTAGNVTAAELDSPGPSKYFAHLALEAAQQWKFEPPKIAGRNVLSDWLLHFQFTGQGTKVIPVQSDP